MTLDPGAVRADAGRTGTSWRVLLLGLAKMISYVCVLVFFGAPLRSALA